MFTEAKEITSGDLGDSMRSLSCAGLLFLVVPSESWPLEAGYVLPEASLELGSGLRHVFTIQAIRGAILFLPISHSLGGLAGLGSHTHCVCIWEGRVEVQL